MYVFTGLLAGFLCLVVFSSFNEQDLMPPSAALKQDDISFRMITGIDPDKEYAFAGEVIPLDNFDIRERLDRELVINSYLESSNLFNLKLANRMFPVIEPILKKNGLPDDMKYLCVAESNLRMATSSAGAKGLWQFIESSGKGYGLEINSEIDERFHIEKSTEAACKFLLSLKEKFGNWTLAAAAYNMGPAGLSKRMQDQKVDSYYDLHLPEETNRYLFRILAIKEIMSDPVKFGYILEKDQLYEPLSAYQVVNVEGAVSNWPDFALQHGTTYRMLKLYNPWIISSALTNRYGKKYEVHLPLAK